MSLGEWAWMPTNWEPMQEAPFFLFKIMKFNIIFFTFSLLLTACSSSEKDRIVNEEEILQRLSAIDSKVRLLPDNPKVVGCQNYVGCKKFIRALFGNIEIFLVQMESERIAREYSQKKDALYIGNWLFDNIQREEQVKKLVKKAIEVDLKTIIPKGEESKESAHH